MRQGSKADILRQVRNLPLEKLEADGKAEVLKIVHEKLGLSNLEEGDRKQKAEAIKVLIEGL